MRKEVSFAPSTIGSIWAIRDAAAMACQGPFDWKRNRTWEPSAHSPYGTAHGMIQSIYGKVLRSKNGSAGRRHEGSIPLTDACTATPASPSLR